MKLTKKMSITIKCDGDECSRNCDYAFMASEVFMDGKFIGYSDDIGYEDDIDFDDCQKVRSIKPNSFKMKMKITKFDATGFRRTFVIPWLCHIEYLKSIGELPCL